MQAERYQMNNGKNRRSLAIVGITLGIIVCAGAILMTLRLKQARAKTEAIQCANILSSIQLAARLYADDNRGVFAPDFQSMSNELSTPKILICPSDRSKTLARNFAELGPNNVSYQYLVANMKETTAMTNAVFRCPIHGHVVYEDGRIVCGDGTVQIGKKPF